MSRRIGRHAPRRTECTPLTLRAARLGRIDDGGIYAIHFRNDVVADIRSWWREPPTPPL